jgi:hypothetical protein
MDTRVLVPPPYPGAQESIGAKDVELRLGQGKLCDNAEDGWSSTIVFATDRESGGLSVHLHVRNPKPLLAMPQSLILTDDVAGREGTVQLLAQGFSEILPTVKTSLPLACDLHAGSTKGAGILHVRVKGTVSRDTCGIIEVGTALQNRTGCYIKIPVIILHSGG